MKEEVKRNSKIKAVVFDIGGVLYLPNFKIRILEKIYLLKNSPIKKESMIHQTLANKFNFSLDSWINSINLTYSKSIEGQISREETLEILSKNLKISKRKLKKIIHKVYRRNFKFNKFLFKEAFKLKRLGYKIGILSDQWYLSSDILAPKKFFKNFDVNIISCNVGMRKPQKEIYKLLIKKLNLNPEEILFIDDKDWNLKPAQNLKMKTILFRNNNQLFSENLWKRLFMK